MSSEMYKLIAYHYAIGILKLIEEKKDFPFFLFCSGFSEDQFKYLKNPQEVLQNVNLSDIIPHGDHTLLKLCNLLHYSQVSLKHI